MKWNKKFVDYFKALSEQKRQTTNNLSQDSYYLDPDSKPESYEYETGILTNTHQRSLPCHPDSHSRHIIFFVSLSYSSCSELFESETSAVTDQKRQRTVLLMKMSIRSIVFCLYFVMYQLCRKAFQLILTEILLDCMEDVLMGFHRSTFSKPNTEFNSDLAPCHFWAFSTMKRELRGKKFRSNQRSAARIREVGGAL
jgi:hypothetical protein